MVKDCQPVLSCTKYKVRQDGVTEVSFTVVLVEFALVYRLLCILVRLSANTVCFVSQAIELNRSFNTIFPILASSLDHLSDGKTRNDIVF